MELMKFPNGFLNKSVDNKRCPMCGGRIKEMAVYERVSEMVNPPSTTDRWCIRTKWQCLLIEEHNNEYIITTDIEPKALK